jgi:2-polyprenyl-3-methyl-5-hydroxy-6-metoxy-1,4-benzoquinol methylase
MTLMEENNIKLLNRRGIPRPSPDIEKILRKHYLIEKEICTRISKLDRDDTLRTKLFAEVYEFAHDCMQIYLESGFIKHDFLSCHLFGKTIDRMFTKRGSMLELGCGRGNLLLTFKNLGWRCRGIDIDTSHVLDEVKPDVASFDILFYRDTKRYDLIVIDQVLEHIPKKDCLFFLENSYEMLKKGGILVSRAPNKLTGPHDVSRWFLPLGSKAEGTHFNEMTLSETINVMRKSGFTSFKTPIFPFPSLIPAPYRSLIFWSKGMLRFGFLFEKLYPFIPNNLKPITTFPIFVPNTIAAQK